MLSLRGEHYTAEEENYSDVDTTATGSILNKQRLASFI